MENDIKNNRMEQIEADIADIKAQLVRIEAMLDAIFDFMTRD